MVKGSSLCGLRRPVAMEWNLRPFALWAEMIVSQWNEDEPYNHEPLAEREYDSGMRNELNDHYVYGSERE